MFQYISREILEILKKKKADNKNKPKNIQMTKTQFKYKKNICCLKKN